MEVQSLILRVGFLLKSSLGIWFAAWAIRYKADWDYKLSGEANAVRMAVVGFGYLLAASLPGPAPVRLVPGLLGISFLCWPNFAYHLTNLFVDWPTTKGRVDSASQDGSQSTITYSFELRGESFGGTTTIKSVAERYSDGARVRIAYDPLNPDQSKILRQITAEL